MSYFMSQPIKDPLAEEENSKNYPFRGSQKITTLSMLTKSNSLFFFLVVLLKNEMVKSIPAYITLVSEDLLEEEIAFFKSIFPNSTKSGEINHGMPCYATDN